jgi:multidrug transporter EmrE-like cation transporter
MKYFLLIFEIVTLSIGQLFFKQSAIFFKDHIELGTYLKYLLNPWLYLAGISFFAAAIVYVKILTNMQLSIVYPIITTLAYVFTILASVYFFSEKITFINIIGISIIFIGILLTSYSK